MKNISGISTKTKQTNSKIFDNITYQGARVQSNQSLPNVINEFFSEVGKDIPPLETSALDDIRCRLPEVTPDEFIIPEEYVFCLLSRVSTRKAIGPDGIPNKVLKEFADILAGPVCSIINSSIRQGVVPTQWKVARISPLPKTTPPKTVEDDIRPIAVTDTLSKIAERCVSLFFNWHFKQHLDINQYGCTFGRSTTLALIKLLHDLFEASDTPGNIIRLLFIDFKKAFDLVNHNILVEKFAKYNFPDNITAWSLDFLNGRSIYTKMGGNVSSTLNVTSGTPQGTVSGPNDFKLVINDLHFDNPYVKYVDDTTTYSISKNPKDTTLQTSTNYLISWTDDSYVSLNEKKFKELIIYFGSKYSSNDIPPIIVNGSIVERVDSFKLLGVIISSDLSWEKHVNYIVNKASKRMHCVRILVKICAPVDDVIMIYCSVVRSVLEYACQVWHPGLTRKQSDDIERIQKRCLSMIFPHLKYSESLEISGLEKLNTRREELTRNLFCQIKSPCHILNQILPQRESVHSSQLRNYYPYKIPLCKPTRYGRDIIPYCIKHRY